jgi:hypothetical protein
MYSILTVKDLFLLGHYYSLRFLMRIYQLYSRPGETKILVSDDNNRLVPDCVDNITNISLILII